MVDLYIARHGQTIWNVQKRMQGRLDSSLTKKGVEDAKRLREYLADTPFDEVISSPSGRAYTTAKLIRPNETNMTTDPRLMEIHLGKWQGKTDDEIHREFPSEYDHYWNAPERYDNDGGETFTDVITRVEDFLQEIERTYVEGRVLIVTHGVAIMAFLSIVKNLSLKNFWSGPISEGTSLTLIRLEKGERKLLVEGSVEHLSLVTVQ
ncbi:histidine phosphatase family protein [Bacillus sp. Y1]|nr:histidine phosphatase family protein [Bacillus sp. Y1]AYA77763.1 histidine phosphatase family protein [Bacillus sp. Y1]